MNGRKLSRALTLALAALLAGCSASPDEPGGTVAPGRKWNEIPTTEAKRLQLRSFESCKSLEEYIEDGMVQEMSVAIDRSLRGGAFFGGAERTAVGGAAPPMGAAPAADGSGAAAPSAYTTTNLQVKGVDEADFVKNDGKRIFVLSGRRLFATESWPPQSLALKGSVEIEGQPREMFLDAAKNRIVVMSEIFGATGGSGSGQTEPAGAPAPAPSASVVCPDLAGPGGRGCGGYGQASTKLTVIDVQKLDAMAVLDSYYLPGAYNNSRRIGAAVRVVLSDQFQPPPEVRYYPESNDPSLYQDKNRLAAALEELKVKNERIIRARTLEQWIPKPRLRRVGSTVVEIAYDCRDFHYADLPVRLGMLTVATLDLDAPGTPPARTTVVAEPGEVYASPTSLYVASRHWWWWPEAGQFDYSYVHKFDISAPDRAVYKASGGFEGHIVDQFSMDEHRGYLRVASTINSWVAPDPKNPQSLRMESTNMVSVMKTLGPVLVVAGRVDKLAPGERIYSARFIGDRGFVVTFRQVDPLFTFDLSDPEKPVKVGELKIPGFSTYIHPLGDRHLLTIGVETVEVGGGVRQAGLKLTVFDVGDLANPKTSATQIIGTASAGSEALQEHKAFNYFPERKLLAIPFTDYVRSSSGDWSRFVSELRVYDIAVDRISPRGAISMKDVFMRNGTTSFSPYYSPWVRRSVMAADPDGNDFVYAISDAGVRVANARSLATPLATAVFPAQR